MAVDPFSVGRHRQPASPKARRIAAVASLSLSVAAPLGYYALPNGSKPTPVASATQVATPGPASPTPTATQTAKTVVASSPARTVALAMKQIGVSGRPNTYTRWYAASGYGKTYAAKYHISPSGYLTANWCAEFLAWLAGHSGLTVPGDALASGMATQFRAKGRFNRIPRVGDFVFYDWSAPRTLPGVGHAGLVVAVGKNGSFTAIEGNNGNAVRKVTRSSVSVVGFGHPNYAQRTR